MNDHAISRACARLSAVQPNDTLLGTDGVVDRYEGVVQRLPGESSAAAFERISDRLMRYDVFPRSIMQPEVCSADGRLRDGTTIVQRVRIGPARIEPAVRVAQVWREATAKGESAGFAYATLPGHPERGVSSFWVTRDIGSDQVIFSIEARSRPGSWLFRAVRPFARWFQRKATNAALRHVTGTQH